MIGEPGRNVLPVVEEEQKPEPGLVLTQPQLIMAQIVLGRQLKPKTVTNKGAQVNKTAKTRPPIFNLY